jgi:MFS family permease
LFVKAPRGQFWLFYTASLFFSFGFSIFFFLFNLYLLGFNLTERSLGLIGGLMAFGSILGTIPAGMCAQRFGIRPTLVTGLLCTVAFSLLRICFLTRPAQFALAILTGMTLCSWAVCLSPTVASLTQEPERPFAFSLMFSSGIGVAALGALVAGQLPGWFRHYSHSFTSIQASRWTLEFACGEAALSILPLLMLNLPGAAPRVRLSRLSNPFLRRFLPAMAVWALVTGSFPPFANVYFGPPPGLVPAKNGLRSLPLTAGPVPCCPWRSPPLSPHGAGQGCRYDPDRNSCRLRMSGLDPSETPCWPVRRLGLRGLHGDPVHERTRHF